MKIDDNLKQSIDRLTEQTELLVQNEMMNAAIAGIPVIGGSLSSLMTDLARRRLAERTVDLANAIKDRIEEIGESKIDADFFKSEVFQTLFALAWEQLKTTHDREKLRLIAAALVNSGISEIASDDRKELFLRILRDLSMQHIIALREMEPKAQYAVASEEFWPVHEPRGEGSAIFQTLAGYGLVTEFFVADTTGGISIPHASLNDVPKAASLIKKMLETPPKRRVRISNFGRQFLAFIAAGAQERQHTQGPPHPL